MNGKQYYNEKKFAPADESLRKALPLVESKPEVKAEVLYLLGDSDYNLEHVQEAANYFRACSALKSPFQPYATKSLTAIKAKYAGIK
jgi:hypothetical protein